MNARIPLVDLRALHAPIERELKDAMARVVDSGAYVLGAEVEAFERSFAEYTHTPEAVGTSSGTDALLASLMALGVGPGDEVVTTALSFLATGMVIARLGARGVLVDVEEDGFHADPSRVERAITAKTKAIVVVHLFGDVARSGEIARIAAARGVAVVEDAAQAIGASRGEVAAGSAGVLAAWSFFPTKNLGALGDAGMVTTRDARLAASLRSLRVHGQAKRYSGATIGGNFRLDALQAAVLGVKLRHLEGWTRERRANAARYREWMEAAKLTRVVTLPRAHEGHTFHQFVLRAPRRDALAESLRARGIESAVYYPEPMHLMPSFASWGYARGDFPHAERRCAEALAIPVRPGLSEGEARDVVRAIADFYGLS